LEMRLLEDADLPVSKHEMPANSRGMDRVRNPSEIQ
jgi:hypothetical protein